MALKTAARLAREHDGTLTVLHVIVPFYMPADVPFGFAADAMPVARRRSCPSSASGSSPWSTKALGTDAPPVTYRVDVGRRVAVHPRRGAAAPIRSS